jgi:hypothetical protein
MPEITPERLAEIEARCKAATPGPWKYVKRVNPLNELGQEKFPDCVPFYEHWLITEWVHPQLHAELPIITIASGPYHEQRYSISMEEADGELLSHARQDIPDLIAALKRAREERDGYADALDAGG